MSKDVLPYLLMGLFCLGFLVLAVLSFVSAFKRMGAFFDEVRTKKRAWDVFVSRTGLQWETKTPSTTRLWINLPAVIWPIKPAG